MKKMILPGIICMPLKKNLKGVPSDWREVKCPKCGRSCYERPLPKGCDHMEFENALCTECALKEGKKLHKKWKEQEGRENMKKE